MPDHERDCRPLLLGERQDFHRNFAQGVAAECDETRVPQAVEDREQHQRVFDSLPQRLDPLDQRACLIDRRLRFRCRPPFVCISAFVSPTCSLICSRRSTGVVGSAAIWSRARVNCAPASSKADRSNDRCPAFPHRMCSLLDQRSFGTPTRQQLRLVFCDLSELALQRFGRRRA